MTRFELACVAWLREQFPHREAIHDEAAERASVRAGIQSAHLSGLESERAVAKYLYLRTLLGPDFDIRPPSARFFVVLGDRSLPADTRIDRAFSALEGYLAQSEQSPGSGTASAAAGEAQPPREGGPHRPRPGI